MSETQQPSYPQVIARAGPIESTAAGITLVGGLGMAVVCGTSGGRLDLTLIGVLIAVIGAAWVTALVMARVTVFDDRIERRSMLGFQTLLRQDVVSWRVIAKAKRQPPTLALFTRPPLRFFYVTDPNGGEFHTWINDLPTSAQTPREAVQEALSQEPVLGPDPATRRSRLTLIGYARTGLMFVLAGVVVVSFMLDTVPEAVTAVVAVVPLLAVAAAFLVSRLKRESIGGATLRLDPYWLTPVAIFVMISGVAAAKLSLDHDLLEPLRVILAGVAISAPLAAAALWLDRSWMVAAKPAIWVGVLAGAIFCGDAMIASANQLLDRDPGHIFPSRINEMHVQGSRYRSYHVVLAAWDGRDRPRDVTVSYGAYHSLHEGERMCVTQHRGALGFGWFTDAPC